MTKSWAAVLAPLILFLLAQGYVLLTGVDLTESQQTALSEILNVILITAGVGGSVGIAKVLAEVLKKPT
jgi:uncharacterized membrane protein